MHSWSHRKNYFSNSQGSNIPCFVCLCGKGRNSINNIVYKINGDFFPRGEDSSTAEHVVQYPGRLAKTSLQQSLEFV